MDVERRFKAAVGAADGEGDNGGAGMLGDVFFH